MYKKIVIVGAGGVGFWTTVGLAKDPNILPYISVFDSDTVEGSGGSRLPVTKELTLMENNPPKKVIVLRDFLEWTMGLHIPLPSAFNDRLFTGEMYKASRPSDPLIVDCSDMSTEQRVYHFLEAIGDRRYLRISYDGNGWVTVAKGLPYGPPKAQGYQVVPNMAETLAAGGIGASAVLTVYHHGLDAMSEYQVRVQTGECLSTYEEKENQSV